jgi:hypothetical protein
MKKTLKANLRTGRKLPSKLAKQFAAANKEYDKAQKKYTAVIRGLMMFVPKQKGKSIGKKALRI